MDYNKTGIATATIASSGSAGFHSQYGFPNDFILKRVWLIVKVQGAQATGGLTFANAANTTTFATLTAGTSAVGTVVSADIAESNRNLVGGAAVRINNIITDASGVYDVYMLFAHSE